MVEEEDRGRSMVVGPDMTGPFSKGRCLSCKQGVHRLLGMTPVEFGNISRIQDGHAMIQRHSLGPPVKQVVENPATAVRPQGGDNTTPKLKQVIETDKKALK